MLASLSASSPPGKNGTENSNSLRGHFRETDQKRALKHSNRAPSYRNYTCQLLAIFAPFIQNCFGSEPSQGCRLRDKQQCMGSDSANTQRATDTTPANHEEMRLEQVIAERP
jgi:hypothetical protein